MSNVYLGQIVELGFQFAPIGFQYCDGQLLPIQQYSALFSLLGTQYGGDGAQTFAVPNLNGRAAIGQGQGPGTSNFPIGTLGGSEQVTLTTANLPAHTHASTLEANTARASTQLPAAGSLLARGFDNGGTGAQPALYVPAGTAGTTVALGGLTIGVTGGGTPFAIRDPYLAINYCIATEGIFPSRN